MSTFLELYIALRIFIVPSEYGNKLSIAFAALSVVFFFIILVMKKSVVVEMNALTKNFVLLITVYGIVVFISKYSVIYTSEVFATALICFIYFIVCDFRGISVMFRRIAFISVVTRSIYTILFETAGLGNKTFELLSVGDKGSTAFVIFLLICVEWRRKQYWVVTIYMILTIVMGQSGGAQLEMNRSAFLLIAIFSLVVVLEWMKGRNKIFWIVEHPEKFFILSAVGIILFSYGWVALTAIIGIGDYHTNIFDTSNNIRVVSNIYVWQQFKGTPELIFYGYDRDIYDVMQLGVGSGFLYYMGTRIVQAHHSILNLYQRCGLIFTTVYFGYIAKFIKKSVITDKNRVLLPVFVISMTMHSYLQTECLLMLALVLYDSHKTAYCEVESQPFSLGRRV